MACFTPHSPSPLPTVAFDTDAKLRSSFTDYGRACAQGDARRLGRPNDGKADLPPPRTVLVPPPFSSPPILLPTPFSSHPILLPPHPSFPMSSSADVTVARAAGVRRRMLLGQLVALVASRIGEQQPKRRLARAAVLVVV